MLIYLGVYLKVPSFWRGGIGWKYLGVYTNVNLHFCVGDYSVDCTLVNDILTMVTWLGLPDSFASSSV